MSASASGASTALAASRRSRIETTTGTSATTRLKDRNIHTTAASSSGVRARPRTP